MNELSLINHIPGIRSEKLISEVVWEEKETVLYIAEIPKIYLNGKQDTKFLILTIASLYLVKSKSAKIIENIEEFSIFDLTKISYFQPDDLTLEFTFNVIKFNVMDAPKLINQIMYLYHILFYELPENKNILKIETDNFDLLKTIEFKQRPNSLLQYRIMALLHRYHIKFKFLSFQFITDWEKKTNLPLKLSRGNNFDVATKVVAEAMSWDKNLKLLVLDSFLNIKLNDFLSYILDNSTHLTHLSFENYKDPPASKFHFNGNVSSKLIEIQFRNCNTNFVIGILNGFFRFDGKIKILTFSRCSFSLEEINIIKRIIDCFPCFISLLSLKFDDGSGDAMNVNEFVKFLSVYSLKSFSISQSSIDTSEIFSSFFTRNLKIDQLFISKGRLFDKISSDLTLFDNICYLDLSRSQVNISAISSLFSCLFTKKRNRLLSLNISDMSYSTSIDDFYKIFSIEAMFPILAEINISGNELNFDHLSILLKFLKKQTNLKYLNISRCFKEQIPKCLNLLAQFIIEFKLTGLEISSKSDVQLKHYVIPFFQKLTNNENSLKTLIIERSGMGDEGLFAFNSMISKNCCLTSVSIDGANAKDKNLLDNVYHILTGFERVGAPKYDAEMLDKNLLRQIMKKPKPKSVIGRLSEYELIIKNTENLYNPINKLLEFQMKMTNDIVKGEGNFIEENKIVKFFRDALKRKTMKTQISPIDETKEIMDQIQSEVQVSDEYDE